MHIHSSVGIPDSAMSLFRGCRMRRSKADELIGIKASRSLCKHISQQEWCGFGVAFTDSLEAKPNVSRGPGQQAQQQSFACHGYRSNPLNTFLGTYAFKPNVKQELKQFIQNQTNACAQRLHEITATIKKNLPSHALFAMMKEAFDIPTMAA